MANLFLKYFPVLKYLTATRMIKRLFYPFNTLWTSSKTAAKISAAWWSRQSNSSEASWLSDLSRNSNLFKNFSCLME